MKTNRGQIRKTEDKFLEKAMTLGNGDGVVFHAERPLRDRIGHNMKSFLLAYCESAGRKARPGTMKKQWHALKGEGSEALNIIDSVQRRRAFRVLERQGYIYRSTAIINGKQTIIFRFTEKGIELQQRFSDEKKLEELGVGVKENVTSDGLIHVVSWDIPEALRRKRALFRHFVKSLGFRLLHKSFFIGEVNVIEYLIRAAKLLGIEEYIHSGIYRPTVFQGALAR